MKKVVVKWNSRLKSGHLWIFANEIISSLSDFDVGEVVRICDEKGNFRGIGYINPKSLIAVRILSKEDVEPNKKFFTKRVKEAIEYRNIIGFANYNSYRLIFGESDGLPGLIVDRYADYLAIQILSAGMERLFPVFKDVIIELLAPKGIVLRNDSKIRELEGLPLYKEVIYGNVLENPVIEERGVFYKVDLIEGQKTGFFLDQRPNRIYLRELIDPGKEIEALDCFSYSGGWAFSVLYKNKSVKMTAVDISKKSLDLVIENGILNNAPIETVREDVFDFLREARRQSRSFDLIILDPPAFIKNKLKMREGMRGYKEINLAAMKLLKPGGLLVTASCSHNLSRENFLEVLKDAAKDAKRQFRIIKMAGQSEDHPVLLSMPETEYLKTFFLKLS